jgi:putative endonuclease
MTLQKIKHGKVGEDAACAYLQKQGYQILERNFSNLIGEIDIIANDQGVICFVEVKTRKSDIFGSPFEAVTAAKQKKIAQVAMSYLKYKGMNDTCARFDVVAVMLDGEQCQSVELIKNAFELS